MDFIKVSSWIILLLYLSIGFVPNWQAVDKIAPQWLMMNCINLFSVSFILYNRKIFLIKSKYFLIQKQQLYILFLCMGGYFFFYSINKTEQIVNISRQFNVYVMFVSMFILLNKHKFNFKHFSWIFIIILGIEIYYVLIQAQEMILTKGFIVAGELKGVTANRNITAFSLAIKIPFLYYLLTTIKKTIYKIGLSILLFFVFFGLLMIQSRASFLATGFGILSFLGFLSFIIFKNQNSKNLEINFQPFLYLFIALFSAILINQTALKNKGADALARAASIGQITTDDSITARIRYYSDVFEQVISSPIIGVGLGNWKLKSIDFDKYDIKGYVVPYHAHSDFIQLGAELGIFGFLSYLSIFIITVYIGLKIVLNKDESLEKRLFIFLLVVSLGVYSVDSSLNFPIARPQVLIVWTFILSVVGLNYNSTKIYKNYDLNLILYLILTLLLPTLFVNNSVYKSLKGQMILLQDFNSNQYNLPLNKVDNIVPEIPNITVTTIPINSVKARYYVNARKYKKALSLLNMGTEANPYLYYSEILKSQIFQEKGQLDSAKIYAKKAFFGLPNNDLHASKYINLLSITRDKDNLEEAFKPLTYKNKEINWKNYLIVASSLYPKGDKTLIGRAKKAAELFPSNPEFQSLYRQIVVGSDGVNSANKFSEKGLNFFNASDYKNAAIQFEKAIKANPLDYAHFENAATANYMINNLEKALNQINIVINDLNPLNGKCEYIKALIFIRLGDSVGACPLLSTSVDSGYNQAITIFDQYCK